jgi:hypothetical protein
MGVRFLAIDRDVPCEIVGSLIESAGYRRAEFVSMWIAPRHRRQGVGQPARKGCYRLGALTERVRFAADGDTHERAGDSLLCVTRVRNDRANPTISHNPATTQFEMALPIE